MCVLTSFLLLSFLLFRQQQRAFAEIDISKELDDVTVLRSGRQASVDPSELLVGDLVLMNAGQRVPADGLLIELKGGSCLKINESSQTGETGLVDKKPLAAVAAGGSSLLMCGTEVSEGSGVMLVLLVGINTSYGQTMQSLAEEDRQTPLQIKLEKVAKLIGWIGAGFAALTFIALVSETRAQQPACSLARAPSRGRFCNCFSRWLLASRVFASSDHLLAGRPEQHRRLANVGRVERSVAYRDRLHFDHRGFGARGSAAGRDSVAGLQYEIDGSR